MPANDVPAEDGARETERDALVREGASVPLTQAVSEMLGVVDGMAEGKHCAGYWVESWRFERLRASLAELAQQADGETVKLVEALRAFRLSRTAPSGDTADLCDAAANAITALLAHVAGQAARHREAEAGREELGSLLVVTTDALREADATLNELRDEVARLRARLTELLQFSDVQGKLLVAYRLRRRPTEQTLDDLVVLDGA